MKGKNKFNFPGEIHREREREGKEESKKVYLNVEIHTLLKWQCKKFLYLRVKKNKKRKIKVYKSLSLLLHLTQPFFPRLCECVELHFDVIWNASECFTLINEQQHFEEERERKKKKVRQGRRRPKAHLIVMRKV